MWRALERHENEDDPWVWIFLRAVANACTLPAFHHKSARERRELSNAIRKLASCLADTLERNGLDAHLIYNDGKLFNGFFLYEDFGESNQARIDAAGNPKLEISRLIRGVAQRAERKIADEPMRGKSGANARAIRFVRLIASRNKGRYGKPLNAVTATAANAVFETSYAESDVRKLLSR
jgi:hypothetical protein